MKKKLSANNSISMRPHSSILVDGPERAAARAILYPVGWKEEDFKKPIIGIASTWSNVTPCNMHIGKLALEAEKGANAVPRSWERERVVADRVRVVGRKQTIAAARRSF